MKNIIVIGKHGQLARAVIKRAEKCDQTLIHAYGTQDCDLLSPFDQVKAFAKALPPMDGLILAAAYTAVDAAEDDPSAAHQLNAIAPAIFAQECVSRNIPMVHISTDYVFSGKNDRPWQANDRPEPLNTYGQSKHAGEKAVQDSGARAAILRTSWVYDGTGKNFMTTMLRLAQTRPTLSVVSDQIGRPTYAGHLADASLVALNKLMNDTTFMGGVFHVTNTGEPISWADFSKAIFTIAKKHIPHAMIVEPIPASQYPTPAKRPAYSVMDTTQFETIFTHHLPHWQDGLSAAFTEWGAANR